MLVPQQRIYMVGSVGGEERFASQLLEWTGQVLPQTEKIEVTKPSYLLTGFPARWRAHLASLLGDLQKALVIQGYSSLKKSEGLQGW